jgi:hypothetical protein
LKEVEGPGHEAEHSTSSSAEVKDGGATPPLPTLLHGVMLNYLSTGRQYKTLLSSLWSFEAVVFNLGYENTSQRICITSYGVCGFEKQYYFVIVDECILLRMYQISKYRQLSFATVLQRALLYTYITTCFD